MIYDVHISECGRCLFSWRVSGSSLAGKSRDPEHEACRAIIASGRPDAAVNFWRGDTLSMLTKSAAQMALWTVGSDLRRRPYVAFRPERLAA